MTVLRFQANSGVSVEVLSSRVPVGTVNSVSAPSPGTMIDIDVDAAGVDDTVDFMSELGFTLFATDPAPTLEEAAADEVPPVVSFREAGGDILDIGLWADGQIPVRIGSTIVGRSPVSQISNRLSVGQGGDVDYTSIKDAVDAAVTAGASASNWYLIEVYPGPAAYAEDPMTLPAGVFVFAMSVGSGGVRVTANNPANDLFTMAGGVAAGVLASGVTDPARAIFRASTPGTVSFLRGVGFKACSNGVIAEGGAAVIAINPHVSIDGVGQAITGSAFLADGAASVIGLSALIASAPAALLPFYAINPIQRLISALNGARVSASSIGSSIAYKDATQTAVYADGGATVSLLGADISESNVAVQIGAGGSGTKVNVQGTFTNNLTDFKIESATGVITALCSIDNVTIDVVPGGSLAGLFQSRNDGVTWVFHASEFRFDSGRSVDVPEFYVDQSNTGLATDGFGGLVTDGGGLTVNVAAGSGWVRRSSDVRKVSWASVVGLVLDPNATNYVAYNDADGTQVIESDTVAPSGDDRILLAIVVTDGADIRFIHEAATPSTRHGHFVQQYLLDTRRLALSTGIAVSNGSGSTKFVVDPGTYFRGLIKIAFPGSGGDASFSYFYGLNGASEVVGQTDVDTAQYDDSGTLTPMTSGYFRADTVIVTSDGRISVLYGDEEFSTQLSAEDSVPEQVPPFMVESGFIVALLVVEEGNGIVSIVDRRSMRAGAGGSGGATDHGLLAGLLDDDHPQYLLADGSRPMGGSLDMGGNAITNVGNVDGVDVSAHGARHNPGGLDAPAIGVPVAVMVGVAAAEGSAANFARGDHQHGVATAVPVSVSSANAEGTASTVARSDHVHAHGNLGGGAQHAVATGAVAGFMSAADKTKIDGVAAGATNTPLTNTDPADVTKAAANEGVSTEAARADHKHDVSTAAPSSAGLSTVPGEGASSSLARADHTHQANTAPVDVTKAAAAIGVSAEPARADHKHDVSTAAPAAVGLGTASGEGAATSLARSDHTHQSNTAPVNVTKAAASIGVSGEPARADHKHDISTATPAVTLGIGSVAAEGTATTLARSDHQHGIPAGAAPPAVAAASAVGVSGAPARSDHTHAHGSQALGAGTDHAVATGAAAGFMSAADKTKIDGVATGATNTPLASTAPVDVTKAAAAVGVGSTAARADHKHDVSTAAPGSVQIGDAAAEGTSTSLARADHVHALAAPAAPADVTKAAAAAGASATPARADHKHDVSTAAPGATGVATASGEGASTALARADHTHQSNTAPANVTKAAASIGVSGEPARADHKHDVTTAAPGAIQIGDAAAEGASASLARADHTHSLAAPAAPADVTKAAASAGASSAPARADHKHDISTAAPAAAGVGTASGEGAATTLARSDHTHQSNTAPANVTKAAAAIGTSTEPARADHKHDVSTAAPAAAGVGTASGEGAATTLARSDHTHQSNTAPANVTKAAAAIGTSTEPARADHKHDVSTAAPSQGIGGGSSEGAATTVARSDHDHAIRETAGPTNLTVGAIADGEHVIRSGTTLRGAPRVYSESEAEQTTTSTASPGTTALTITKTAAMPAGRYIVRWSFTWRRASAASNFFAEVWQDGPGGAGTRLWLMQQLALSTTASDRYPSAGMRQVTLDAAAHTFSTTFYGGSALTSGISQLRMELVHIGP